MSFIIAETQQPEQLSWDMAKQIIQTQNNLAIFSVTVLVGMAILLLAGTWIYNVYLNKRRLKNIVENLKKEITEKLTKYAEDAIKIEVNKLEKSINENLMNFDAEKSRLFALVCKGADLYPHACVHWADAIIKYAKIKDDYFLRVSVDALNTHLTKCEGLTPKQIADIKNCLSFIPEILEKERKQIEDKLNKISKISD